MRAEPKNEEGAKQFLKFTGTAEAENVLLKANNTVIGSSTEADSSNYNGCSRRRSRPIEVAESIAQFLDRDTRPDSPDGHGTPGLQTFIKNPNDVDGLTKSLESQKKSIFTSRDEEAPMTDLPTVRSHPPKRTRAADRPRRGRRVQTTGTDRPFPGPHGGHSTALVVGLVWLPAVATAVVLSFASWTGVGSLDTIKWIGTDNYVNVFTIYPPFKPAPSTTSSGWCSCSSSPPCSGSSWPCCWTASCADPLLPDRAVPAGGPVAGPGRVHLAAHLLARPGLLNAVPTPRSTGTGTLAGTSGRCWSPPAGSTPATSCCSTWLG